MNDFISVAAEYMKRDETGIIFTAIRELHRDGRFRWNHPPPPRGDSRAIVSAYAASLQRRPSENIEHLLRKTTTESRTLATRTRYAINRLFVMLGWNVADSALRTFLELRLSDKSRNHRFISFNYDLALDKGVQRVLRDWDVATGYGFTIPHLIHHDPTEHPGGVVAGTLSQLNGATDRVTIIKPHGSLNWLVPLKHGYEQIGAGLPFADHAPVIPLTEQRELRYCESTHDFQYVWIDGEPYPVDVLPAIIPPVKEKDLGVPLFERLLDLERRAIADADEVFVIGWSLPDTDANQENLIRAAVKRRSRMGCASLFRRKPMSAFKRLVLVSYGSPPEYFEKLCDVFGFPRSKSEVFNDGFVAFADNLRAARRGCLPFL